MLRIRLHQAFFLLASWALATSAHASYGQMRLDGIELFLAFALTVAYGLIVDLALLARLFQYRAALVVGFIVALVLTFLLLVQGAPPGERAGIFKVHPGGREQVVLVVTSAVFLPFILIAPFAQYRAMRHAAGAGRVGSPCGCSCSWRCCRVSSFSRTRKNVFGSGSTQPGRQWAVRLEQADLARYWNSLNNDMNASGAPDGPTLGGRSLRAVFFTGIPRGSGVWHNGVDDSALIAANERPSEPDRTVLRTLIERHFYAPSIRAKLIWDALEPGGFSRQLAPHGLNEQGVVSEEVIPLLLERLEKYGEARLCPGGRMMDADRAVLNELVLANVRKYDEAKKRELNAELEEKKRDLEMSEAPIPYRLIWKAASALGDAYGGRPVWVHDWGSYPQRVERLCRGPE